jgi:hypothetical protein
MLGLKELSSEKFHSSNTSRCHHSVPSLNHPPVPDRSSSLLGAEELLPSPVAHVLTHTKHPKGL